MTDAISLMASPASLEPGQRAELSLKLSGPFAVGGVYVSTTGVGELQVVAGQGLRKVSSGLVHERPKSASGGAVQFGFAWLAPAQAGAVRFSIYAVGADGNNQSSGDTPLEGSFDFAYGCQGQTFYFDGDGDGDGRADTPLLGCSGAAPETYVASSTDCDDYNDAVHPGAAELCNLIDDDCNGQVDENVLPVELWPDADGDGYYDARTEKVGAPMQGCAGLKGWAALPGDCQPMNAAINPGAKEICNNLDEDCDGDIDERVRPTCGEGWCRRESASCDISFCRPGTPEPERCNFLDDDCDGEIDEDAACPSGQVCDAGACVPAASGGGSGGGGGGGVPQGQAGSSPGGAPPAAPRSSGCALGSHSEQTLLWVVALSGGAALLRSTRTKSGRGRAGR